MRIVCVDDEKLIMELTVSICKQFRSEIEVVGFIDPLEMLEFIKNNSVDIAILDIDMPQINGINLAIKVKQYSPDTKIIFQTGYSQYAVDAFKLHASGYLLKPINKEQLFAELEYALSQKQTQVSHIFVKTFGNFDVFVDDKAVNFERAKSKEILAYLVDREGASATRVEIFSALWEEGVYDRPTQKKLDVIIRSLKTTLNEYGISEILEIKGGTLRVCPEKFDCDAYKLFKGDVNALNSYRGEYMTNYPWATISEANVEKFYDEHINKNNY